MKITPKTRWEQLEHQILSNHAAFADITKGRAHPIPPCDIRTDYQRDRDRILHSNAFRRLKHKTQVFICPQGDHCRTRLTHTLEVAQIARTIARALRLNEDLTEAISLAHDLGHTPFGHMGERTLAALSPMGFSHNEQSLRVVDELENDGDGLNLTYEVRDGILHHSGADMPCTLEGEIVRIADPVAYINHDIDDSIRAGIISNADIPRECTRELGNTHSQRINTLVLDIIEQSEGGTHIVQSPEKAVLLDQLREFMFEHVYKGAWALKEEARAHHLIAEIYQYFENNPAALPIESMQALYTQGFDRAICDYIAGMTDRYVIKIYKDLFVPEPFEGEH